MRIFFTLLFLLTAGFAIGQGCQTPILDNSITETTISANLPGINDLGQNPLQKVCFSITHTWVGDLSISLTSPGGQQYLLMADANNEPGGCGTNGENVDVCIVLGTNNPLTNNQEYVCNPGPCPSGTCCLTGNWTVPCGGVSDPITGAPQAPNCDLNDFNLLGQPVNGDWTFTISDVCDQDNGMLDNVCLYFVTGTACCCGQSPAASCADAPFVGCACLENGVDAMTGPPNITDLPPMFCGSIENEQWIAFNACWCAIDLTIQTGDGAGGVEAQLFTSCGPDYTPKTNCITVLPNSTGTFSGISCVPGNTYYLLVDGVDGDTISYQVKVTEVPEQPVVIVQDTIFGPTRVCEGDTVNFTAPPVLNAAHCDFNFSGDSTNLINPTHGGVTVVFGGQSGWLCFTAENCSSIDSVCVFVQVDTVSITVVDTLSFCENELPADYNGFTITAPGILSTDTLSSFIGCDSILQVFVIVNPNVDVEAVTSGLLGQPGASVTLSNTFFGSNLPQAYLWNGPDIQVGNQQDYTVDVTIPGTYILQVTDTLTGCSNTSMVVVIQDLNCPQFNLPIAPGDSCHTAPPFCANYLDGYCSNNGGYNPDAPGNLGSIIPCTIENNQWLSFVSCADTVQLVFSVYNCLAVTGMEFFVLQTTDCQMFTALGNCFEVSEGGMDTLTLTGLVPGEQYYLMADGIGGDICGWGILSTIGISDGVTYQEDNTPGQVTGPDGVCAGGSATFTFTDAICDLIPVGGCPFAAQQFCLPQLDTCNTI